MAHLKGWCLLPLRPSSSPLRSEDIKWAKWPCYSALASPLRFCLKKEQQHTHLAQVQREVKDYEPWGGKVGRRNEEIKRKREDVKASDKLKKKKWGWREDGADGTFYQSVLCYSSSSSCFFFSPLSFFPDGMRCDCVYIRINLNDSIMPFLQFPRLHLPVRSLPPPFPSRPGCGW